MNQKFLCNFELVINEKYFNFSFQPGITNFDDIKKAIAELTQQIDSLEKQTIEAQTAKQAESANTTT
jgi:hypothetical protein